MPPPQPSQTKAGILSPFLTPNWEEWQKVCPSMQLVTVSDKCFLYHQGESCTGFFWIKQGVIKLSHLTLQGNELTLALLQPGHILGHLPGDSVMQTMEESAQALGNVALYRIEQDDFKKLLSHSPEATWHVFGTIYARQQQIERKLRAILTQPVEKRVISTLLELAKLFGTRCTHGFSLEIFLTQQELADLVGASRPVVSTIMNDFRNRGMLDYTREQICVNDTALSQHQTNLRSNFQR